MTILAIQRGAKIALFRREVDAAGTATDADIIVWSADDAERFGNAVLALLPRVREQEAKDAKTGAAGIAAELKAAQDKVSALQAQLTKLRAAT